MHSIAAPEAEQAGAGLSAPEAALLQLARALAAHGYRFTTITPATHAQVNARPGNAWAEDLAGIFGWSRAFKEELIPAGLLELMRTAEVLESVPGGWRSRVRISSLNERLFLHSAFPTAAADAVFFGPDSYRFVAALENHLSLRTAPVLRAVDIGCGAGPGAIALAALRPQAAVWAVDINPAALRLTRINAILADTANVRTCQSDLLAGVSGSFDLIVANPPYLLDAKERTYRHGGGPLGAGLSLAVVKAAQERLAPGGTLLLYTGVAIVKGIDPFRTAVAHRLAGSGLDWSYREVDPDVFGEELRHAAYADADRIAAIVLVVTRLAG